jgi:DNA-binding PadR family transcriptional regulator
MRMSDEAFDGLGRFAGPATLILSSLAQNPKHGYAITQDVEAFAEVKLQPGTLYGALGRLERDGLIEPLAADGRRQPYGITPRGSRALAAQLAAQ